MTKNSTRPAVVILAAGISKRMNRSKHLLRFSEEDTFLEHIIKVYRKFNVSDIIVVVNESFELSSFLSDEKIEVVTNNKLEYGRFYSIQMGLKEIKGSSVYIQNIDNPFVNPGLLMYLFYGIKDSDFAVPVNYKGGGHPILLSGDITGNLLEDFLPDSNFNEVLRSFNRKDVFVDDPFVTVNINTPGDYKKYFGTGQ